MKIKVFVLQKRHEDIWTNLCVLRGWSKKNAQRLLEKHQRAYPTAIFRLKKGKGKARIFI